MSCCQAGSAEVGSRDVPRASLYADRVASLGSACAVPIFKREMFKKDHAGISQNLSRVPS